MTVETTYASVCSGIESASVAFLPLGLKPLWFSEHEPHLPGKPKPQQFPSAVLQHHYPQIPNLGDMCNLPTLIRSGLVPCPDVLIGGTPCQSFSVAGLRNSLEDKRGLLTLKFVELVNEIDKKRIGNESIVIWENVPGVLNTKDNAFGCFLAGLSGENRELKPPRGKWTNAGFVLGPQRTVAWRVLNAQYFGVAQRRRRVFVVASARDGFDPRKVLFESEGVRRDSPTSRETEKEITGSIGSGSSHWSDEHLPLPTLGQSSNSGGIGLSNQEIFSQYGAGLCVYRHRGLGDYVEDDKASTLRTRVVSDSTDVVVRAFAQNQRGEVRYISGDGGVTNAIANPCGQPGQGVPTILSLQQNVAGFIGTAGSNAGIGYSKELSPVLTSTHNPVNVCVPIHDKATRFEGSTGVGSGNGLGVGKHSDPSFTLTTGDRHPVYVSEAYCVQGSVIGRSDSAGPQGTGINKEIAYTLNATDQHIVSACPIADTLTVGANQTTGFIGDVVATPGVRRLTPVECERLQGLPDNYTQIPWRGKLSEDCPDGIRYRSIGNSMASPVIQWLGKRILKELENPS